MDPRLREDDKWIDIDYQVAIMNEKTHTTMIMNESIQTTLCPNCEIGAMTVFHETNSVPTNSCILLDTKEEAIEYPKGNISLGHCDCCGFISNTSFDEKLTEYSGRYEETQGFSETFNQFHKQLAERLIEKHELRDKKIIEIGCGKGEFLVLLCELGQNTGIGFDPGFSEERVDPSTKNKITFIKDFYSEKYTDHHGDFLCCKMTLEHIHQTADFIKTVRRSIADRINTTIFFQIPNAERIIESCAFEDIYYEHCSYFTKASLTKLFTHCQFDVLDVTTEYDDQYLTIEAKPTLEKSGSNLCSSFNYDEDLANLQSLVSNFPKALENKISYWRDILSTHKTQDKKLVLWGSGSKAVSFLTTLEVDDELELVVDINPYKHGYFMAGTGHQIVAPEALIDYKPATVIVMNAIYEQEVRKSLADMGLYPEILSL